MKIVSEIQLRILPILIVFAACELFGYTLTAKAQSDSIDTTKVMSFNVRFGKADDGPNRWDARRDLVIKTVKDFDPDILGTQEMMGFQAKFFQQQLTDYGYHGTSRIPTDDDQEQCTIFYRSSRFEKTDAGHFWLSESPDQPGSISWDSSLPRMASWVKLVNRRDPNREFFVFNTHFDHVGQDARLQASALLRQRIQTIADGMPTIVTGDFNSAENSIAHRVLLFATKQLTLIDTFQSVRTRPDPNAESTSSRWSGNRKGRRIDWILCSSHWDVADAAIDRSNDEGRYPSDHYPVTAHISLKSEEVTGK